MGVPRRSLRTRLACEQFESLLRRYPLFADAGTDMIRALSAHMRLEVYLPSDFMLRAPPLRAQTLSACLRLVQCSSYALAPCARLLPRSTCRLTSSSWRRPCARASSSWRAATCRSSQPRCAPPRATASRWSPRASSAISMTSRSSSPGASRCAPRALISASAAAHLSAARAQILSFI